MLGKILAELLKELTEQQSPKPPRRSPPINRTGMPPRTATGNRPRSLDDLGELRSRGASENAPRSSPGGSAVRRQRPAMDDPQRGSSRPDASRRGTAQRGSADSAERRRSGSEQEVPPAAGEIVVVGIPVSESVEEHVARHLNNSSIAEHTAHLGESVAREQQQMAQHVSQSLGAGPRGNLSRGGAGEIVDARLSEPLTLAEQIAKSLGSPQQIRTAFILGEVLKRPDF